MDLAIFYHHLTDQFLVLTGWSDKMAHLNVGMAIYVLAQLALRTRRASLSALLVVIAIEIGNETLDALFYGELRMAETLLDLAYTCAWPTVITLVGLYRRERWKRQRRPGSAPALAALNTMRARPASA